MITRRAVVRAITGAVLGAPLGAAAQQATAAYRIGFLAFGPRGTSASLKAFEDGLRQFGYVNGRNIAIEHRFADGDPQRLADLATELVRLKVDVVMAGTALAYLPGPAGIAAEGLTKTIPIVMIHSDPVGSGLVTNLARPGGNITGLSLFNREMVSKQLALINEVIPKVAPVAVLRNPANSAHVLSWNELEAAARVLRVQLQLHQARLPGELEAAFVAMTNGHAKAVLVLGDTIFFVHRERIAHLAKRHRLPTMSVQRELAEAGGLMAYGANISDIYRRAGAYVAKILKGAKPADLPVEQPTTFHLVINLKTAEVLRLTIPKSVLLQADEVIQ